MSEPTQAAMRLAVVASEQPLANCHQVAQALDDAGLREAVEIANSWKASEPKAVGNAFERILSALQGTPDP